jgi:hypothetical protein
MMRWCQIRRDATAETDEHHRIDKEGSDYMKCLYSGKSALLFVAYNSPIEKAAIASSIP